MSEAAFERALIRQRRAHKWAGKSCAFCCTADPLVLQKLGDGVSCRRCAQMQCGFGATEDDHIAGRRNAPEVQTIDANEHARRTALQEAWPKQTRQNPSGDPRRAAAATLRGVLDHLALAVPIIERTIAELEGEFDT